MNWYLVANFKVVSLSLPLLSRPLASGSLWTGRPNGTLYLSNCSRSYRNQRAPPVIDHLSVSGVGHLAEEGELLHLVVSNC